MEPIFFTKETMVVVTRKNQREHIRGQGMSGAIKFPLPLAWYTISTGAVRGY